MIITTSQPDGTIHARRDGVAGILGIGATQREAIDALLLSDPRIETFRTGSVLTRITYPDGRCTEYSHRLSKREVNEEIKKARRP